MGEIINKLLNYLVVMLVIGFAVLAILQETVTIPPLPIWVGWVIIIIAIVGVVYFIKKGKNNTKHSVETDK